MYTKLSLLRNVSDVIRSTLCRFWKCYIHATGDKDSTIFFICQSLQSWWRFIMLLMICREESYTKTSMVIRLQSMKEMFRWRKTAYISDQLNFLVSFFWFWFYYSGWQQEKESYILRCLKKKLTTAYSFGSTSLPLIKCSNRFHSLSAFSMFTKTCVLWFSTALIQKP